MSEIILYQTDDGESKIELHLQDGTVWLSRLELAELFQTSRQNIEKHIKAIFEDEELNEKVVSNYRLLTTQHGAIEGKVQSKEVMFYNLDMILAIGYRVRSARGAQFRKYASTILKEYLINGAVLNDEKLKQEPDYFKKLLNRIREIRTSERVFYQQVLDIYKTSVDYNKDADTTRDFFKTVQNKMLFAVTGSTAPEIIYTRLDASKPNLGLTHFKGQYPKKSELSVSKNYLDETEITNLNLLTTAFLDAAEYQAQNRIQMTMADWKEELDRYLTYQRADILKGKGNVSRKTAEGKIKNELEKYLEQNIPVETVDRDFVEVLNKKVKEIGVKK